MARKSKIWTNKKSWQPVDHGFKPAELERLWAQLWWLHEYAYPQASTSILVGVRSSSSGWGRGNDEIRADQRRRYDKYLKRIRDLADAIDTEMGWKHLPKELRR